MMNTLLDFYAYQFWEFLAKDTQIEIVNQVRGKINGDSLVSWALLHEYATKAKPPYIALAP